MRLVLCLALLGAIFGLAYCGTDKTSWFYDAKRSVRTKDIKLPQFTKDIKLPQRTKDIKLPKINGEKSKRFVIDGDQNAQRIDNIDFGGFQGFVNPAAIANSLGRVKINHKRIVHVGDQVAQNVKTVDMSKTGVSPFDFTSDFIGGVSPVNRFKREYLEHDESSKLDTKTHPVLDMINPFSVPNNQNSLRKKRMTVFGTITAQNFQNVPYFPNNFMNQPAQPSYYSSFGGQTPSNQVSSQPIVNTDQQQQQQQVPINNVPVNNVVAPVTAGNGQLPQLTVPPRQKRSTPILLESDIKNGKHSAENNGALSVKNKRYTQFGNIAAQNNQIVDQSAGLAGGMMGGGMGGMSGMGGMGGMGGQMMGSQMMGGGMGGQMGQINSMGGMSAIQQNMGGFRKKRYTHFGNINAQNNQIVDMSQQLGAMGGGMMRGMGMGGFRKKRYTHFGNINAMNNQIVDMSQQHGAMGGGMMGGMGMGMGGFGKRHSDAEGHKDKRYTQITVNPTIDQIADMNFKVDGARKKRVDEDSGFSMKYPYHGN